MRKKEHKKWVAKVLLIISVMLCGVGFVGGSVSAWGPERTTYTNESPADYATFNSITNNAAVGDERNFVRVVEIGTNAPYDDEVEVTPGKEYEVYIYYHNNAATNTNKTGYGIATNTRISSAYPTKLSSGERGMISGIVSWSYVKPSDDRVYAGKVWDEAYLTTKSDEVVLRYKTGTAKIHNGGKANGSVLPTALFTEGGTPIGYNKLTGTIPGCAEYSGFITYTLVAEKVDSSMEKQVSTDGTTWADEVTVKPGEYVTYKVKFNNTGNTKLTNVIFKDVHDEGLDLRFGTTTVYDVNNVNGKVIDDIIDISGYNTGDAAAGALVQIIYQMQVKRDKSLCSKTLRNTISVDYNSSRQKTDDATVVVACEPEDEPKPEPEPEEEDDDCETNPEKEGCWSRPDPEPEPEKNCKTNPEMEGCQSLPNTGPVEVVMAAAIVAGIIGGGYYLYRTKKVLRTAEGDAMGKVEKKDGNKADKAENKKDTVPEEKKDSEKKEDK